MAKRDLSDNPMAEQMRVLVHAIERNTAAVQATMPQLWDAEALMKRYSASWAQLKALVAQRLGVELGDRRTARLSLDQVLKLDTRLRDAQTPISEALGEMARVKRARRRPGGSVEAQVSGEGRG